jgi:hypothetical protein
MTESEARIVRGGDSELAGSSRLPSRPWTTNSTPPAAFAALFTLIRDANIAIDANRISASDAERLRTAMRRIDPVFDIYPKRERNLDEDIEKMIKARQAARKFRNFAESDRIRDDLQPKGTVLEDTPAGVRWRRNARYKNSLRRRRRREDLAPVSATLRPY